MREIIKKLTTNPVVKQSTAVGDSSLGIITIFFKELFASTRELYKLLRERKQS